MKEFTCCFSGHRNIPETELYIIQSKLINTIIDLIDNGVIYFAAGGALGFDTLAAQTVLELKKYYKQIKLILVLPCINQPLKWKKEDVETYEKIKQEADEVIYSSEHYFRGCMQKRNRQLADMSKYCICYKTADTGGTAYTVKYAEKKQLEIINLSLDNLDKAFLELDKERFATLPDINEPYPFELSEKFKKWEKETIYKKPTKHE